MSRSSPDSRRCDPLRAIFLCLAVLLQLLVPPVVDSAQAKARDGCVALGASDGHAKSPTHVHGQQCAHCRPQAAVLAAPTALPARTVKVVLEAVAEPAHQAFADGASHALPPPTGPPALSV